MKVARRVVVMLPGVACLAAWAAVVWGVGDNQNRGGMVAFNAYDMHALVTLAGAVLLSVAGAAAIRWRRAWVAVVGGGVLETLGAVAMGLSFGEFAPVDGVLTLALVAALIAVVRSRRW